MEYVIARATKRPTLQGQWNESPWDRTEKIAIANFLSQSKSRHPRTEAKAVFQDDGMFVFFRVFDKYIRCVCTEYQSSVCGDSCVEFFVEPKPGLGYFNFEINCGGTLLLYYCVIPAASQSCTPINKPDKDAPTPQPIYNPLPPELGRQVRVYHSMPKVVDPEIDKDMEWRVEYFIPFAIMEKYVGDLGVIPGQVWRANFYKCGDNTSHPHWASWAPMGSELNFHLPKYYAPIKFQEK